MKLTKDLKIKLFADGANIEDILDLDKNPFIKGFTTNPTLMKKAGINDYEKFSKDLLEKITNKPISLEVFADDFSEMKKQAFKINSWGENIYVKIPIMNTLGQSSKNLVRELSNEGICLNITAIMTTKQVSEIIDVLNDDVASIISVFAGRVADTGVDPVPHMIKCKEILKNKKKAELLWASPRELLNVFQADSIDCDIITATSDILKKLELVGKDLLEFSNETVKMFRDDALKAGFKI